MMVSCRFIHCKKHSHEDEVRRKREAYGWMVKQEEARFATMYKRKRLSVRYGSFCQFGSLTR